MAVVFPSRGRRSEEYRIVSILRRRGRIIPVKCRGVFLPAVVSLLFLLLATIAPCQTAPGGATGPLWVSPVKESIIVYTSSGTEVARIGVLNKGTVVQVLQEDRGWYKIRFVKGDAEFVGWVLKQEVAAEGTPAAPPKRNPKPDPKPEEDKEPEPEEEERLSIEETHEKLMPLTHVNVGESPKYTKSVARGMKKTIRESGSTGQQLFAGGPVKLEALRLFEVDEVIEVFVEDRIRELKKLLKEGHPDFARVISWYILALESYQEGKRPDFESYIRRAESFWRNIDGIEVGF